MFIFSVATTITWALTMQFTSISASWIMEENSFTHWINNGTRFGILVVAVLNLVRGLCEKKIVLNSGETDHRYIERFIKC